LINRLKEPVAVAFFILFLSALCGLAWLNPVYDWDVLPYTALAETSSSNPVILHAGAYQTVDSEVPPEIAQSFHYTGPDPEYRRDLAANPWHFAEQLPFYSVKPLYVLLLRGIHRAGPSALKAARLVSAVSFATLGIVLFLWLRRSVNTVWAAVAACCVLATPEFLRTGAQTTPDAFFSALALLALYLLFSESKLFLGVTLLVLLPLVRADGLILVALVLAYLAWKKPEFPKVYAVVILIVEVLVQQVAGRLAGAYPYQLLFFHSFIEKLAAPAEISVHLTLREYFQALYVFVLGSLGTPRPLYLLLGLVSLIARRSEGVLRHLAWLGLGYAAAHILLFPVPESRYLVVPFSLIILWTVSALANGNEAVHS
jgi:Dolichyl-phosphate-mannose-protein mannosyltransferase